MTKPEEPKEQHPIGKQSNNKYAHLQLYLRVNTLVSTRT